MSVLICPVCGEKLNTEGKALKCGEGHSFDISKEGYVNLLLTSKNGERIGDSKDSARARHSFLQKNYYRPLRDFICERMSGTVLDICCGEGYYDEYDGTLYGFDISREMIRLASKSRKEHKYFVATLAKIPIESACIDTAIHLFAPFNDGEFARIIKEDGILYSVIPGEEHLFEMKAAVYESPYKNDEKAPETERLKLKNRHRIKYKITIPGEDLRELFAMTPYFYRTSEENKSKLDKIDKMDLTLDFVVLEYVKNKEL